ncbi:MAG: hypothetical protein H7Y38_05430 [Armatimonadetes bacterium]|nr:hypothetical protein [Armatimonadota bacterium]
MQSADKDTVRLVKKELVRHALDTNETQVAVIRGLVHLYGKVRPLPGREHDFDAEVNLLYKALKTRPGVSDVVFEWQTPYQSDKKTTSH